MIPQKEFDIDALKGKISLNDYMQFIFYVYEQNKTILNKLDIIIGKFAEAEDSGNDEKENNDFLSGLVKNVIEDNPDILKMFGAEK